MIDIINWHLCICCVNTYDYFDYDISTVNSNSRYIIY